MSSSEWLAWAALVTTWATPAVRRWDRWLAERKAERAAYWQAYRDAQEVGVDLMAESPPPHDWWWVRWRRERWVIREVKRRRAL